MLNKILNQNTSNNITMAEVFDVIKANVMQHVKLALSVFATVGFIWGILSSVLAFLIIGSSKIKFVYYYYYSKALCFVSLPAYQVAPGISAKKMVTLLSDGIQPVMIKLGIIYSVTAIIALCIVPVFWKKLRKEQKHQNDNKLIRGGKLVEATEVLDTQIKMEMNGTIPIGVVDELPPYTKISFKEFNLRYYSRSLKIEKRRETDGVLVVGTKGAGKGLLITPIIAQCYEEKGRGIIYDQKGDEYFCRFFDPEKDILLNFCDVRGEQYLWNFFLEMETVMEASAIAYSLIPPMEKVEPFWVNAPRDILEGLILYCYANNKKTYKELWEIITAPATEIQHVLNATPGAEKGRRYLEDPESKMCGSVLSVLVQQCTCFSLMSDKPSKSFNLTDWIKSGEGFIYLTSEDSLQATLQGFYTLFIETTVRKTLSAGIDLNRRISMFLEEFSTLNQCPSLLKALNQGRSAGFVLYIMLQSLVQLEKYGKEGKEALIAGCGIKMVFRLGDNSSAEYFEKLFGKIEEMQSEKSFQMKVEDSGDGTTKANREKTKELIMASQMTNMPNLHAIVSHPGLPLTIVNFPIIDIPNKPDVPKLLLREDLLLANKYKKQIARSSDTGHMDTPELEEEYSDIIIEKQVEKAIKPVKEVDKKEKELNTDRDNDMMQFL